jgi:hypothetical protein
MIEETMDPTTWITSRTTNDNNESVLEYENTDGKKWKITGNCIACGLCEQLPNQGSNTTVIINKVVIDGEMSEYTRTLQWVAEPGTAGACLEVDYQLRKDISITPDLVNEIEGCTLSGEWISNAD